jgi:hypothetical protein
MLRYLVGFFITIGLIILLIILLFSGGGSSSNKKVITTGKALDTYASTDAQVRLTIDGPIVANQEHRQINITVDRNNSQLDVIQGYDGGVVNTQTFANTQASYAAFLHSLELLNFTKGNTTDSSLKSESGHCALGYRYVFEIIQNGSDVQRFWATSCAGPHSFDGNVQTTIYLFKQQIPEYGSVDVPSGF